MFKPERQLTWMFSSPGPNLSALIQLTVKMILLSLCHCTTELQRSDDELVRYYGPYQSCMFGSLSTGGNGKGFSPRFESRTFSLVGDININPSDAVLPSIRSNYQ